MTACDDFDPDKLDVFGLNNKKKLPGEREALFPAACRACNREFRRNT